MLDLRVTPLRIHLFLLAQLRHITLGRVKLCLEDYVEASHNFVSIIAWNCTL
jgi:hypothetical protein